ncbi:hypothetical protein CVT24_003098 [Panaeolus cyanescens]|uniref:DRBM domain-containing protein n=1 Tax=Panaeolus cyanescens TaxID=181874 RepID=A0A409W1S2_9AGAR|nr:hypothetical protein CVT24_003098 [Panaeolus cyanescens]
MSNNVTTLHNFLQARHLHTRLTFSEEYTGERHNPTWKCEAKFDGIIKGVGYGNNKADARQEAAGEAFTVLRDELMGNE